ncbi:MAG: L-seryl-tRNA(Sec) selenium transferase [Planctomycetaceae bacterium]|nr:L-seryl-tRNA(Sec) selenium transferase [Planctomycetaceae bacterium]
MRQKSGKPSANRDLLRALPQVGELLEREDVTPLVEFHGHELVAHMLRAVIDSTRQGILDGAITERRDIEPGTIVLKLSAALNRASAPNLCRVINATGVILHTSLGRAVLPPEAWAGAADIARGYSMLELNRETGKRGDRDDHIAGIAAELTGAEAATVVNNNAAATWLILNELAAGKEAIIARAHMVEIGGSYRMMDVMKKSSAMMVEVGATNKAKASDYEKALSENTGCIIKVHTSNYKISGFTEYASLEELVEIGRRRNVPVVYDLGAGSLVDLKPFGLVDEPMVQELVKSGADLVCFSGDKLLGGPQAGICVGKKEYIARLKKNQMFRMMRCDKITLALLEATLRLYRDPKRVWQRVPTLAMISEPLKDVKARATKLHGKLDALKGVEAEVVEHEAFVGGGSLPTEKLASYAVSVKAAEMSPDELASRLRTGTPSIFGRIAGDRLLLDCRTVSDSDCAGIDAALSTALMK